MTVGKIRIFLKTAVFQNYLNMTIRNHINTLIKIHTIGKGAFKNYVDKTRQVGGSSSVNVT